MKNKNKKSAIHICMGSACHQLGVYDVLPVMEELLEESHLSEYIELRGAFCLGSCMHGIVMQYGNQFFGDINLGNVREKFCNEILPAINMELQLSQ